MAKLINLRQRCICSACGASVVVEESGAVTDPRTTWSEYLQAMLVARGWRVLIGPPAPLLLCEEHAAAYQRATEDEIRGLRMKLLAFRVSDHFGLEFYIYDGRLVSPSDSRQATVAELGMWEALRRIAARE